MGGLLRALVQPGAWAPGAGVRAAVCSGAHASLHSRIMKKCALSVLLAAAIAGERVAGEAECAHCARARTRARMRVRARDVVRNSSPSRAGCTL